MKDFFSRLNPRPLIDRLISEMNDDEGSKEGESGEEECNCQNEPNPAQDKYLGKRDEKRLKEKLAQEGETIERLKTGSGRNAGKYDLYVKPNGDIVVKPKGGVGSGDPTGWSIKEL